MPLTAAAEAVTPTAMLARVRETRAAEARAGVELLVLAAEWADAHPAPADAAPNPATANPIGDDQEEFDEYRGIPEWSWRASGSFAVALGRTTAAGDALIRDALVLRHRLPRVWSRTVACEIEAWRARRIAQAVLGSPDDVCEHLDATVSAVAHKVGPTTLDRLLDEAMLRLYPEERELAQVHALDARYATLHKGSINDTGVADMTLRCDWKDVHDFDQALSEVAAALAAADARAGRFADSLDVRRSRAVGVLADPASALALLTRQPAPTPRKDIALVLHLAPDAVFGSDPVVRCDALGRALLAQQVRDWCGRSDTHVSVQPVIDLSDHTHTDAYEIPDRLKVRNDLLHPTCVFPWCTRSSRRCDQDHVVPHDRAGATCDCNIAPLCRRHHRLKTHAGWRYTPLETGSFLWSDPHGQQFLRDPSGTLDVTPPGRPVSGGSPPASCRVGQGVPRTGSSQNEQPSPSPPETHSPSTNSRSPNGSDSSTT